MTEKSPSSKIDYFDPEYVGSRHAYVTRLRELVEKGAPEPQEDWDALYVFSGPEFTLDPDERPKGQERNAYNQTLTRLESGFNVAKQVTALRLKALGIDCDTAHVTPDQIQAYGPNVYFDGFPAHNQNLADALSRGEFATRFGFPDAKLVICGTGTRHTGEQFSQFPADVVRDSRKTVLISDLYHIPRIEKYFGSKHDVHALPREKIELYFHEKSRIAMRNALQEARKVLPYERSGDLNPNPES